jgi:hypothetical protein
MKSSRIALLLVLTVCSQTAIAQANDAQPIGANEIQALLLPPGLDIQQQFALLFFEEPDSLYAWAVAAATTPDPQTLVEGGEEGADFEPTIVVSGRSEVLETIVQDSSPQWEGFPMGNVLPLDPWISEGSTEDSASPSAFAPPLKIAPWIPVSVFVEKRVSRDCADFSDQENGTVLFPDSTEVAPSQKYGNLLPGLDTQESPPLAERLAQWKAWALNDYCTAFRYISQQFAQFDWSALLEKIPQDESAPKDFFDMEQILWDQVEQQIGM